MTPESLLIQVMSADEDVTIPRRTVNTLVRAGLVVTKGCSDGDYIDLTKLGRAALQHKEC